MNRRVLLMALLAELLLQSAIVPGEPILVPPIAGLSPKDLYNSFDQLRGKGRHEAIDILAPRGTPVRAVVAGRIQKLFLSKAGGKTIYLFDERVEYSYYYAHLNGYREDLREDQKVKAGEIIGYVGSSGNADPRVPHLHFAIFELGPLKQWWKGTAINPYPLLVTAVKKSNQESFATNPPSRRDGRP
jgi:murein DD-endopeptidase MepM/ murein hydrolase activator NlpD